MWVVPPNLVRVVRSKGKIQWKREIKRKKAQKNFPSSRTVGNFCGEGFFWMASPFVRKLEIRFSIYTTAFRSEYKRRYSSGNNCNVKFHFSMLTDNPTQKIETEAFKLGTASSLNM